MPACNKCHSEIAFKKNANDKWYPVNPDGSEHWTVCNRQRSENARRGPHASKAERKAANKSASDRKVLRTPCVTQGKHTKFYESDTVPPWEESLGDFMCFEGCC